MTRVELTDADGKRFFVEDKDHEGVRIGVLDAPRMWFEGQEADPAEIWGSGARPTMAFRIRIPEIEAVCTWLSLFACGRLVPTATDVHFDTDLVPCFEEYTKEHATLGPACAHITFPQIGRAHV